MIDHYSYAEKRQAEFCAVIRAACALSRDGVATMIRNNGGPSTIRSNGIHYWFEDNYGPDRRLFVWNFVDYPSQMKCLDYSWAPNRPLSALEQLAEAAE